MSVMASRFGKRIEVTHDPDDGDVCIRFEDDPDVILTPELVEEFISLLKPSKSKPSPEKAPAAYSKGEKAGLIEAAILLLERTR